MHKVSILIHKIVPRRISKCLMIGALVGIMAVFILFISEGDEPDAGLVIIPLMFFMAIVGALLWLLFNRLIYGGFLGKIIFVVGLFILTALFFI